MTEWSCWRLSSRLAVLTTSPMTVSRADASPPINPKIDLTQGDADPDLEGASVDHAHVVVDVRGDLQDLEPCVDRTQGRVSLTIDAECRQQTVTHVACRRARLPSAPPPPPG